MLCGFESIQSYLILSEVTVFLLTIINDITTNIEGHKKKISNFEEALKFI